MICGWTLGLRNKLPSSITTPIDISFAEFVEQDMKSNELHLWNKLQSEVSFVLLYLVPIVSHFQSQMPVRTSGLTTFLTLIY